MRPGAAITAPIGVLWQRPSMRPPCDRPRAGVFAKAVPGRACGAAPLPLRRLRSACRAHVVESLDGTLQFGGHGRRIVPNRCTPGQVLTRPTVRRQPRAGPVLPRVDGATPASVGLRRLRLFPAFEPAAHSTRRSRSSAARSNSRSRAARSISFSTSLARRRTSSGGSPEPPGTLRRGVTAGRGATSSGTRPSRSTAA